MKYKLPPPSNWIEFEELCLNLWGIIWGIPDSIDFNSTNSQGQNGVDIAAIPEGKTKFWGVQCKNKNLYVKSGKENKLTKATIDEEINKAFSFKPKLEKLIIATSALKDKELEEYARIKTIENIANGNFQVQICFWEFIERRVQEDSALLRWYQNKSGFIENFSIDVSFSNGIKTIKSKPKFIRNKIIYRHQTEEERKEEIAFYRNILIKMIGEESIEEKTPINQSNERKVRIEINGEPIKPKYPKPKLVKTELVKDPFKTYDKIIPKIKFRITIKNEGSNILEHYKLMVKAQGTYDELTVKPPPLNELIKETYQKHTFSNGVDVLIEPEEKILVQKDKFISEEIIITPSKNRNETIELIWQLLAKNYSKSGKLIIEVEPEYEEREKVMFIELDKEPFTEYEISNYVGEVHYKFRI